MRCPAEFSQPGSMSCIAVEGSLLTVTLTTSDRRVYIVCKKEPQYLIIIVWLTTQPPFDLTSLTFFLSLFTSELGKHQVCPSY